jgi:lysophospholipase L1-like esterase
VALVGDSYAAGMVPYMQALAEGCGTPYYGDGHVGSSVLQWVGDSEWLTDLRAWQPTVVLISLGGNDFQRQPVSQVHAAIEQLVSTLRSDGALVLWVEPLSLPFADTSGIRDAWKAAVGRADSYPSLTFEYPRAQDGVHLMPSGYEDWAGKIWRWMSGRTLVR